MTSRQLRQKYLDFFKSSGHKIIPSASLVPENDPTVLFTTAGMHPLVPFLLGEAHPEGRRLVNVQKCVRMQDIDEVGDNRHETFFEMLGNWSLGDYFKQEAIEWSWEFLTAKKWLGLEPKKLAVSVFIGDRTAPKDDETAKIWQSLGVPAERIAFLPKENNWWGPAGQTGPCGPDTEMFYWVGESKYPPAGSNPGNNEAGWLEIWNDVFMQYNKKANGDYELLKNPNVDTGMGLERVLVALNGFADVFQVDTFWPLIQKIQEISGHEYIEGEEIQKSMRVIADHLRTATMIMGDDKKIAPSNVDQGYIVRRLIRRAVRHGRILGIKENFCSQIVEEVIKIFADVYPEVNRNRDFVLTETGREESKFRNTVEQGLKKFNDIVLRRDFKKGKVGVAWDQSILYGDDAFDLFQTFGFPKEIMIELCQENDVKFDEEGFEKQYKKHQELSRAGAEQKFKGGLADTGEMSVKYHTASHLLLAALRSVLGEHVIQRGSNITADRLRLDFSHPEKLTAEQKNKVEELVNYAIKKDYPVRCAEMTVGEAKAKHAVGVFEDRYGSKVKVYSVGNPENQPEAGEDSPTFSKEICGGPHVERTGILGIFKIIKEEAVSSGVRRVKAVLE